MPISNLLQGDCCCGGGGGGPVIGSCGMPLADLTITWYYNAGVAGAYYVAGPLTTVCTYSFNVGTDHDIWDSGWFALPADITTVTDGNGCGYGRFNFGCNRELPSVISIIIGTVATNSDGTTVGEGCGFIGINIDGDVVSTTYGPFVMTLSGGTGGDKDALFSGIVSL